VSASRVYRAGGPGPDRAGAGRVAEELGWAGVIRIGLVQVAMGAVVVLMTSTLNRVMVVELGLPAVVPGLLVGLHFGVQLLRPRMGFGSDVGGRRVPWIWRGMALVLASGLAASAATAWMEASPLGGLVAALLAFVALGVGISAAATPLLAYLAERVPTERMAGAAAVVWIMMILGIIMSAGIAGGLLDPYSPGRLVAVTAGVVAAAFLLTCVALWGRDEERPPLHDTGVGSGSGPGEGEADFRAALARLWEDRTARRFAIFVFVSMLAYSMQDIILEPFAGTVFGMTPGESTRVAGLQHGGVLAGMAVGAVAAGRAGSLRAWSAAGCLASAVLLVAMAATPFVATVSEFRVAVFGLGLANGVFAVAAIGLMMGLTVHGEEGGAGLRMGLWGGAQALAYGLGGFGGAAASDAGRALLGSEALGYGMVFALQAILFLAAAWILGVRRRRDEVREAAAARSGPLPLRPSLEPSPSPAGSGAAPPGTIGFPAGRSRDSGRGIR